MAVPNNNNNTYPTGARNDGGSVDDRSLRGSGERNDAGSISLVGALDLLQLNVNQLDSFGNPRLSV